jgi:hypothetical protein
MNPQHGQAGHRCDIAVGAPLNSPAAATNSQPQNAAAPYTVNNAAGAADENHSRRNESATWTTKSQM